MTLRAHDVRNNQLGRHHVVKNDPKRKRHSLRSPKREIAAHWSF